MRISNWWKNLSVSKKLYTVVGVMAFLIASELLTLNFAMHTLSAVRAFVGGEGMWSKAQKSAVYNLQKYAVTQDEIYYQKYLDQLKVPLGDHNARLELEKRDIDLTAVTQGFLEGQNHPNDIEPMVQLVRRFHQVPHLARAIEMWRQGDDLIVELMKLGDELHREMQKKSNNSIRINGILDEIAVLDYKITEVENQFSLRLGEASRWLEGLLIILLISAVIMIEGTGLYLTVSFARGLTKTLNELNAAATSVGEGNFSIRVPVRSRDELGQLAESINNMTDKLREQISERLNAEHASQAKNLFLANMSHEIRTPLNAILGFSELLRDPTITEEEKNRYSDIIKRTGNSLTSIINDILDVTKVEAEQLEIETKKFSLTQMMADLEALLRLRGQEKGIELTFQKVGEISEWIQSDPTRLRQILVNIIGNSIKFTDHGSVSVTYEVTNDKLLFTIKDTGTGISSEQKNRLFKPFSQGDSSVRKRYGGTGLGLIISQRLAQLLGGDVGISSSQAGVGSTFFVKISYFPVEPQAVPHEPETVNPTDNTTILSGKKILVVEDSIDNQMLANLFLSKAGAEVEFANHGAEGVQKLGGTDFDLVLMDMQMPVMDGYTATQLMRKLGFNKPIIALTGYAMKNDQEKCISAGCDAYISKPFDRAKLVSCVQKFL